MKKRILVTGGAGFLGSHVSLSLIEAGYDLVILDNLSNSNEKVIDRINIFSSTKVIFINGDIRDAQLLRSIFDNYCISAVMHFSGLKSVCDSVADPLLYFDNNVVGTITLLKEMNFANVKTIIFSSSATVYKFGEISPISETAYCEGVNPYGRTKLVIENILRDLFGADNSWHIASLRYFNPVGAHPSGLFGEDSKGPVNNLMPYILNVAIGKCDNLNIYGNDYDTCDGTGIRDYIHVMDLVDGHLLVLKYLFKNEILNGVITLNLGTGVGYSVLQLIETFEASTKIKIPYQFHPRRCGDIDKYWADPSLAFIMLGWKAKRSLSEMCYDSWNWKNKNPRGYE